MYSVFLHDLHIELDNSGAGIRIGGKLFTAPTQADDLLLLSLTKNGVGILICACWKYSCKWRFRYSCGDNGKSFVIVYSGTKDNSALNRTWKYGENIIKEVSQYKHLGSIQTKCMETPGDIASVVHSLRGTFLSLQSCGVHSGGMNPISTMKLYTSVVLPRALFGCEMWSSISRASMLKLEKGTSRQRSGKGAIRKRFPLQKPRWEKTKLTIRYLYHETYRKPNEQLFSQ